MKTLAVISRKGGAGKTTLAINLSLTAHLAGWKVLVADIDPQRSASDALRARAAPGPALAEINAGKLFQARSQALHDAYDVMLIDTPAAPDADVAVAVNSADLCVLVCRPTFLDIASVARSAEMVRRLGKAGLIVLNQAPSKRGGAEPASVQKAIEALRFCGLPIAPVGLRSRTLYQQAIARGLSVGEWDAQAPAAREVDRLWSHVAALLALDGHGRDARAG
ncbi:MULTISPECIES: ParA family protein [Caulobacter]|uniref:Chromosome partitioning protein n=1 Tax=Caulobacter rhizosphaerae TaxID=2010972 RepID=A0ABU1N007_9CAUL|nr:MULTISPECIES: ParA family protein [Caulobacter]KQZ19009.1 chromosome partitioning protein ParA [Caulobacter sp. Root1472]MDR6531420.1 chromosome partitioning protein [Caulobacter rhizosphaerae]